LTRAASLPHIVEIKLSLPARYDVDRLVPLVRDPRWLFVYWETRDATRKRVEEQIGRTSAVAPREVLRLTVIEHDSFAGRLAGPSWTVELAPMATSWYVEVGRPDATVRVEIGLMADGHFIGFTAPVHVTMPPSAVSSDESPVWRDLSTPERRSVTASVGVDRDLTSELVHHVQHSPGTSPGGPQGHRLLEEPLAGPGGRPSH
jgi:hypothetical protein